MAYQMMQVAILSIELICFGVGDWIPLTDFELRVISWSAAAGDAAALTNASARSLSELDRVKGDICLWISCALKGYFAHSD
jgi:hypothetical protein